MTNPFVVSASSAADVATLIPHLLGFHPEESVVFAVVAEGRLQVTGRVDLGIPPFEWKRLQGTLRERFVDPEVILFIYSADEDARREFLRLATSPLVVAGGIVGPGGIREWLGGSRFADVAPLGPVPEGVAGVVAAPAASRDDILLPPSPDVTDDFFHSLYALGAETPDLFEGRLVAAMGDPHFGIATAIRLALHIASDDGVAIALRLLTGTESARQQVAVWRHVIEQVPEPWSTGAIGWCGFVGWAAGQGTLVVDALDRLEALEPSSPVMHKALDAIIAKVVPPSELDAIREDILASLPDKA